MSNIESLAAAAKAAMASSPKKRPKDRSRLHLALGALLIFLLLWTALSIWSRMSRRPVQPGFSIRHQLCQRTAYGAMEISAIDVTNDTFAELTINSVKANGDKQLPIGLHDGVFSYSTNEVYPVIVKDGRTKSFIAFAPNARTPIYDKH